MAVGPCPMGVIGLQPPPQLPTPEAEVATVRPLLRVDIDDFDYISDDDEEE